MRKFISAIAAAAVLMLGSGVTMAGDWSKVRIGVEGALVLESLRPVVSVLDHVQEDLPDVARRVHVAVPHRLALAAPAHAVDVVARAGVVRVAAPARVEPVVRGRGREGAAAAPLARVMLVQDHHTCVQLKSAPELHWRQGASRRRRARHHRFDHPMELETTAPNALKPVDLERILPP